MYLEILLIGLLIFLQYRIFRYTGVRIEMLRRFFPNSLKGLSVQKFRTSSFSLDDPAAMEKSLDGLGSEMSIGDSYPGEVVELVVLDKQIRNDHPEFSEAVRSTNSYLLKNKGAAADFGILKDICERRIDKIDNDIGNMINVPLYIGLAGTFLGIIIGLWGVDFEKKANRETVANERRIPPQSTDTTANDTILLQQDSASPMPGLLESKVQNLDSRSINKLLNGVIAAMLASLIGLVLTVVNTTLFYRSAAYEIDGRKNDYFDFIQRELLPVLNIGVARSLGNFKDVLNHFIVKFGENMDDYKESGHMLNQNLQAQQIVLQEINKLSVTDTSIKIAEVFNQLEETSEHLKKFQSYQKGLNSYIDKTDKVVSDYNSIIEKFNDFNTNLQSISEYINSTTGLQKQFQDSLERHFPTIDDHRTVWRQSIDDLNKDLRQVYGDMAGYFKEAAERVKKDGEGDVLAKELAIRIRESLEMIAESSALQRDQFASMSNQLVEMRNDFRESQRQQLDTSIKLVEALVEFKNEMSERRKS